MKNNLKETGPDLILKYKAIAAWSAKIEKMTEFELNKTIEDLNKILKSAGKLKGYECQKVASLMFALKALNIAY